MSLQEEGELFFGKAHVHYHHHSIYRRAFFAFLLVFGIMFFGTIAFHYVEGYSYIDSFYFMSMLATAEGPTTIPVTVLGKLLASVLAFVSIGAVIFALGFIFGPFFGRLVRSGERELVKEEKIIKKDLKRVEKKL
ncbi:MAG: hypothetical protein KGH65_04505 [Candidatus Micrarchaeota archaeon]|nr:hypothetical protein [Candidatus Micrarchaeota archaeon]